MDKLLNLEESKNVIDEFFSKNLVKKVMVVCGKSWRKAPLNGYLHQLEKKKVISCVYFEDFQPNPIFESVIKGVKYLQEENCDGIIAAGGGSAIDVAKCIKNFSDIDVNSVPPIELLQKNNLVINRKCPFLAIPTTAGTGSERTSFAVIYFEGNKYSIENKAIIPNEVILYPDLLIGLPIYQKKVTMLDALCHAVESYWSINSTDISKNFSRKAIELIRLYGESYINNSEFGRQNVMKAANLAGMAINLTKTTAAHAMSYKLSSIYHWPHGHAVAVCLPEIWKYMFLNMNKCIDVRGEEYLKAIFKEIAVLISGDESATIENGIQAFENILKKLDITVKEKLNSKDLKILVDSVNVQRLKNNPVKLEKDDIQYIYRRMFKEEKFL